MRCQDVHMPLVTVRTAAELAGKDRSTILCAIENGKLSATKSDLGRYLIDPAELERVYGSLRVLPTRSEDAPPHDGDASRHDAAERELGAVREMLERERSMYDRDRNAWEAERTFMRGMLERHTEQIKLLTDQRERDERERQSAPPPRSLLARVFGRR